MLDFSVHYPTSQRELAGVLTALSLGVVSPSVRKTQLKIVPSGVVVRIKWAKGNNALSRCTPASACNGDDQVPAAAGCSRSVKMS